jgi:hypothetical protein
LAATTSGAAAFVTPVVSISAARIPVAKVVFDAFQLKTMQFSELTFE